jgi:alkylation response protein AidB-like acyl-CoA dehydrogenase
MEYLDLDLELTEEQIAMKKSVHKFAREVLRPAAASLDAMADPEEVLKKDSPYWDVMKKMKKLGYHTVFIPENFGGLGLSPLDLHIFWEEIAWGSGGLAVSIGVDSFPAFFASMLDDDRLVKNIIDPYVNDTECRLIGCWAITEPDHGSDTLMVGTPQFHDKNITGNLKARRDGDGWVLSGQKSSWVSNGPQATHALLFLNIDQSMGMAGGGVAIVPLDLPGVSKGRALNKMGQREVPQGEIFFDDVRIPDWCMVADPETYEAMLDITLSLANGCMGAIFTGVARAAFEEALAYAKERVQGGVPICRHQLVQKKLFDMFMKVETARAISRRALIYNMSVTPPNVEYSIASKVYCTQAAFEVAHEAVQIFGGYGVSKEYYIEALFRDARGSLIEDGSNDVLSLTAAEAILRNYGV